VLEVLIIKNLRVYIIIASAFVFALKAKLDERDLKAENKKAAAVLPQSKWKCT